MLFFLISTAFQCKHWGFLPRIEAKNSQEMVEQPNPKPPSIRALLRTWLPTRSLASFPSCVWSSARHQWLETPSGIFNGEPPLSLRIDEFTIFSKQMKADCMSMARTWKNVRRCFSTIKLWKVLERTSSQLYKSIPVRHTWHARATDFYWLYRRLKVHFWCSHHSASASWANSSSKVGSLLGTTQVVSRDKCWQWEMM